MLLTFVLTSVKEAVFISNTICIKLLFTGEFNEFFSHISSAQFNLI